MDCKFQALLLSALADKPSTTASATQRTLPTLLRQAKVALAWNRSITASTGTAHVVASFWRPISLHLTHCCELREVHHTQGPSQPTDKL